MAVNSERGGALIFLFIAVALFGALSYAFLQDSRGSTTMMTGEATKAAGYQSQDCANAVDMATKRLTARGCGGTISTLADGSNTNPGAPTDGSCSIYHPNGGGVKSCGLATLPAPPPDTCTTDPIGSVCASDGAFYIGDVGGNRIYAASADQGAMSLKTTNTSTAGTSSVTDGLANTNAMITAGAAAHPAANSCNNKSPPGTWYVPAKDELNLIWTNRVVIGLAGKGFSIGTLYWSSTDGAPFWVWTQRFSDGVQVGDGRTNASDRVRCVRR